VMVVTFVAVAAGAGALVELLYLLARRLIG
jgi:hypothetical protein